MKITNKKRIASLKDTRDIFKIGAWLDYSEIFKENRVLKVIWYLLAIESTIVQFSLFSMVFYKYVLIQDLEKEFGNDKETFMKWGNDSVCNIAFSLSKTSLSLIILFL